MTFRTFSSFRLEILSFDIIQNWLSEFPPIPQHGLIHKAPIPLLGDFAFVTLRNKQTFHLRIHFDAVVVAFFATENLLRVKIVAEVLIFLFKLARIEENFSPVDVEAFRV